MSARAARTKITSMASASEKTLADLPAKEIAWVKMTNAKGELFVITSPKERTTYSLYQRIDSGFKRIAKSINPKELDMIVYPESEPQ